MITGKKAMQCAVRFFRTNTDKRLFGHIIGRYYKKPTVRTKCKNKKGKMVYRDIPVKISKTYRKMIRTGRIA